MGCGTGTSRFLLCIFNFIFFVVGVVVLGVGIWIVADKASFLNLIKAVDHEEVKNFTAPDVINQIAYALIACGAVTFFLSFLGYCGAIRESTCLLYTYASVMILILVAEIAIGATAYSMQDKAKTETKKFLSSTITDYYSAPAKPSAVSVMWDSIMKQLECCGVDSYQDFAEAKQWQSYKNTTVPVACCKFETGQLMDSSCPTNPSDANSNWKRGCYNAAMDWFTEHKKWVFITMGVIVAVELILIILSFCLTSAIKRYRRMPMCAGYE